MKELIFPVISKINFRYGDFFNEYAFFKGTIEKLKIVFNEDSVFLYIENNNKFIFNRIYTTLHFESDNDDSVFERLMSQIERDFIILDNFDYRSLCLKYFKEGIKENV